MIDLVKLKQILHENDVHAKMGYMIRDVCEMQMELFKDHQVRLIIPGLTITLLDNGKWSMKLTEETQRIKIRSPLKSFSRGQTR